MENIVELLRLSLTVSSQEEINIVTSELGKYSKLQGNSINYHRICPRFDEYLPKPRI